MSDLLEIPVIDISDANAAAPQQLLDAACTFGFVFVANNDAGIPPALIDQLFRISQAFFALPTAAKAAVSLRSNHAGKNHGWLRPGAERLDPGTQNRPDVKEAFNLGLPHPDGTYDQPLPPLLHSHRRDLATFQKACELLCRRILAHVAVSLALPADWFTSRHDRARGPVGSVLRLLYYPAATVLDEGAEVRAGAHSDYGSMTCLFRLPGQRGLEIKTPTGEWASVPVSPRGGAGPLPILVNIGDLLEDWTCGLLKSTVHRVVFAEEKAGVRYSMAYFCHPLDEALLEAVPSRMVEEHARRENRVNGKKGVTARDHLMERLAATSTVSEG